MTEQVKIVEIDEKSPYLQAVIELGDANRKTLGHLSYDTFFDHAKRRQITIALATKENFIGYLMYRKVRLSNHIVIVHLCVAELWRGRGITRKLVNYLSLKYPEFYGIKLKCRRDYGLEGMWSKLGFVPSNEKPGNSKEGKPLTVWWLDHGHPNLFSVNATEKLDSKLCAIIDTTVFFNLYENDSFKTKESESLLADWLQDDLELCVTDEIFNAINNINCSQDRKYKRLEAETFTKLPYIQKDFESFLHSLKKFMLERNLKLDESQIRQLAITLASDCPVFVTRHPQILNLTDEIYETFKLEITNPSNLIINLDEIRRSTAYQPVRLAGSNQINIQSVPINQINQLTDYFWINKNGETKANFQRKLRRFITNNSQFICHQLVMEKNQPLGLIVYNKLKSYELEIPLLRVRDDSLAGTLARYLIFHSIRISAQENRYFTRITDPYLEEIVVKAIQEDAFIKNKGEYIKVNIAVAETASQLSQRLNDLAKLELEDKSDFCLKIAKTISQYESTKNSQTTLEIERFLWPAKIIDANLPTWIIPIKPFWAKDLFDEELANHWLFGSKTDLALKRELVFYRSKRASGGLKPGLIGRIIWYVSNDKSFPYGTTKLLKACSRLDEVIVDKPEKLYRQFRHLAVYKLEHLIQITKNNPNEDIMAIRFSDTQIFTNTITLEELQDILKKRTTVQGLFKITPDEFAQIYEQAN